MLTLDQASIVADAIYQTEGRSHTKWLYGIKTLYKYTTPHQACINTIEHVSNKYNIVKVDRYFITMLADIYCPLSTDPVGNKNWKHNMVRILHIAN